MKRIHDGIERATSARKGLRSRSYVAIVGTLVLAAALAAGAGSASQPASAAVPPTVELCNGVYNVGGQRVECHVTVTNVLDIATGIGSSIVNETICVGSPGSPECGSTVETEYPGVITGVSQCNGSGNGGGSVVECDVVITNTITGSTSESPGTVNQCVGSGEGGGEIPLNCGPPQSTSDATITQCNGSANGGGATLRVTCSYGPLTETAALRVTVNQCNGSANGGGALVTCFASESNTIIPADITAPVVTTPVVAAPVVAAPVVTAPVVKPYASTPDTLAQTGFDSWPLALIGTIAILMGTLLMMRSGIRDEVLSD